VSCNPSNLEFKLLSNCELNPSILNLSYYQNFGIPDLVKDLKETSQFRLGYSMLTSTASFESLSVLSCY
jgi:hypothetical protein